MSDTPRVGMSVSRLSLALTLLALTACGGDPPSNTPSCEPGTFCECAAPNDCPLGEACLPFLDGLACQQAPDAGADTSDAGDVSGDTTVDPQPDATDAGDDATEPTDGESDADPDVVEDTQDVTDTVESDADADATDTTDSGDTALIDVTDAADAESDSGRPTISPPLSNPWIAVETNRFQDLTATPPRSQQIAVLNTSGIFYHINSGDREMSSPTWSPDGRRIAFIARNGASRDLKIVDLTSGEFTTLLEEPPAGIANLDWDFSGRYIAFDAIAEFTGTANDTRDIYVVNVESAETTRLTTDSANDTGSRFDVAGNIWFTSNRDGRGSGAVFSVTPETPTDEVRRTDDLELLGRLSVDPTGGFLLSGQAIPDSARMIRVVVETEAVTPVAGVEANAPDIAPDGIMMVFTTSVFGGSDLVLANAFTAVVFDRLTEATPFTYGNATIAPVESGTVELNEAFDPTGT